MAFGTPVVGYWLKWEVAQWVYHAESSDNISHHEQTLYPTAMSCSPCYMHFLIEKTQTESLLGIDLRPIRHQLGNGLCQLWWLHFFIFFIYHNTHHINHYIDIRIIFMTHPSKKKKQQQKNNNPQTNPSALKCINIFKRQNTQNQWLTNKD